jgi:hypothetical protein
MADNIDVTPGGGKTIAADEIAGVLYQRIKPTFGADGAATDVSTANPLPVVLSAPGTSYTNRSGTITTGGVAQVLAALNTARRGYRVVNLSAGDLWINDKGATAAASQPSFKLIAGAAYESPAFGCPTNAISIFGATTGQAFESAEG